MTKLKKPKTYKVAVELLHDSRSPKIKALAFLNQTDKSGYRLTANKGTGQWTSDDVFICEFTLNNLKEFEIKE